MRRKLDMMVEVCGGVEVIDMSGEVCGGVEVIDMSGCLWYHRTAKLRN